MTQEQKTYATNVLIAASREAAPTVRDAAAQGRYLRLQQAAHSTMLDHQFGRKGPNARVGAFMRASGITDAVFHPNQKPRLKLVDDWVTVYANDWWDDEEGGGGGSPHIPGLDLPVETDGGGGGGGAPTDPNAPTRNGNGKDTELVTPSGAHVQVCTVYYGTLAMLAGVGGGSIALVDAIGVEVGISLGAGIVISAPALAAICAILVAVWSFLALIC